ncbi:XRE family transcriptional regulator [Falseniella ignava]|uniref:XRE family transcriptional regulator n=1 Tax=Falseniella ignava TaxID=137730 RepID=A0A2I1K258_9LACT|nr:XRE family transcriptional regulator [Falseniella ignava]PKY89728.1 XRE family transcriptional regulator [Falseniella ignava]
MDFSNVIKYLRKKNNITQSELAKILDVGATTVSSWERGANFPTMDRVVQLANFFNVPIGTFFGNVPNVEETVSIPILGIIACGEPITADENINEYREVLKDNLPSGNLFYLEAKGDSMSPKIPDGSYVLVREQSDVENGEIAAVLLNGDEEATLKKVRKLGKTVLLEALNDAYEPYVINEDNPARIIGKAVKLEVDL